jgi:hypothetical protein
MAAALVAIDAVSDAIAALEGSTASVITALRLLSEHLALVLQTVEAVAADEETRRATATLRSSSVRLERMVRRLERTEQGTCRTAGYDAATLRKSLVLQLRAHAELEQEVLSQVHERLTAQQRDGLANSHGHALAAAGASTMPTGSRATRWRHPLLTLRKVASKASGRS